MRVQPQVWRNLKEHGWGFAFPTVALTGLAAALLYRSRQDESRAFLASGAYLAGMLRSAAFGIYPYALRSNQDPALGLTIYNTAVGR